MSFEAVDHFAKADVARVGVDAAAAAGEDVVVVGRADGTAVSWEYFGTGWVIFGHNCLIG